MVGVRFPGDLVRVDAPTTSARALLLTVLGEFVLADGATAWTSTLLAALATLGVEPKSARQALARSGAAGLVEPERVGRNTRWSLSPAGVHLLASGAERIYRFGHPAGDWDGRWLLVLVSVPEGDRHLRHALRSRLGWLGFAAASPGVWISPWVGREDEAHAVIGELGLEGSARTFRAEAAGVGDPAASAGDIWDLGGLAARYEAFVETARSLDPADDREAFAALIGLVHQWRSFPVSDPDLPALLLPPAWPGREAAAVFAHRREDWSAPAWRWWRSRAGAPSDPGASATSGP